MKVKASQQKAQAKSTLAGVEQRLHRACDQMMLIHGKISDLQRRHNRASKVKQSPLASTLQMQLSVLQGMYNAYYKYAAHQAEDIMLLYTL